MLVTISIINYNYGNFLERAIESALNQLEYEGVNVEVLVVDDGSTDGSDEIANKYNDCLNFRFSKTENKGFAFSLTRAIEEALGEYVFLMDADDFFDKKKIVTIMPYFIEGYLFVSDHSTYVNKYGNIISGNSWGSTSTIAINKNAVKILLPVKNEIYFHTLLQLGLGKIIEPSLTYYTVHNFSMTNRKDPGKQQKYLADVTHALADTLQDIYKNNQFQFFGVSKAKFKEVVNYFRYVGYYNNLECSLELGKLNSFKYLFKMLLSSILAKKIFNIFNLKMIVKTILLRPSFPKNK